jgi:arylsulfatase A-like enzyme
MKPNRGTIGGGGIGVCVTIVLLAALSPLALAAGKARHVVIVVMDGLRRDSVVEADMPNLVKLMKGGAFFAAHHPVYLSTTEVNGTALATGARPARSGVVGNREYRPDVELLQPVDTQGEWAAWKGDQLTDGKWINAATLPQIVRAAGGKTVVAGTKGVAMLWDRSWAGRSPEQPTLYAGDTIPAAVKDSLVQSFGPIPNSRDSRFFSNEAQDHWTTRALIEKFWANGLPQLSVLWLSEPDYSQHGTGPGHKVARAGLKSSDDCLGKVLAHLDSARLRDVTDVIVTSDHGFSTVAQGIEVFDELYNDRFDIGGLFLDKPEKGAVMMVGLGGSIAFYVGEHDRETIDRLVRHMQVSLWAGVIFTRDGIEGTFKLQDAGIDAPGAADVVVSMRWSGDTPRREGGMPGALLIEGKGYKTGQGMHGSLSRYDMLNTLIAAGPDFKAGFKSEVPSGNFDVAPTVLAILGIDAKTEMDGRVLTEALTDVKSAESPKVETTVIKAARRVGDKDWKQYLKVTTVNGKQRYYDEGNAGAAPEK